MDRMVLMMNVYAHELAEESRTTQLPELSYEPSGCTSDSNDRPIDVDNKCVRRVDFRSRGE